MYEKFALTITGLSLLGILGTILYVVFIKEDK